jgi:hypothetical protein
MAAWAIGIAYGSGVIAAFLAATGAIH